MTRFCGDTGPGGVVSVAQPSLIGLIRKRCQGTHPTPASPRQESERRDDDDYERRLVFCRPYAPPGDAEAGARDRRSIVNLPLVLLLSEP